MGSDKQPDEDSQQEEKPKQQESEQESKEVSIPAQSLEDKIQDKASEDTDTGKVSVEESEENVDEPIELVEDKAEMLSESTGHITEDVEKPEQQDSDKSSISTLEETPQDNASKETDSSWTAAEEAKEIAKENIDEAIELVKDKAGAMAESGWLAAAQAAKKTKQFLAKSEKKDTDKVSSPANPEENVPQDKVSEDTVSNNISTEEAVDIAKENIDEAIDLVKDKAGKLAESGWLAAAQAAEKTASFLSKSEQKDADLDSTSKDKTPEDTDSNSISAEEAVEIAKENIDEAVELVKDKAGKLAESGWLAAAQAAEKTTSFLSKSEQQSTGSEDSSKDKISVEEVKEIAKENIDVAVTRVKDKAGALAESTKHGASNAAEKTKTFFSKALHWSIVMLGYLTALAFMALLAKSSVEVYENNSALKWEMFGADLLTFMAVNWLIYLKRSSWQVARVPIIMLASVIFYSALRFPTSDDTAFTLFDRPTEAFLTPAFLAAVVGLVVAVWLKKSYGMLTKVLLTAILSYCGSTFVYGIMRNVGLEESFLGVDFFARIPYYFLQPTYISIEVLFPIAILMLLRGQSRLRKDKPKRAQWVSALLLLLFLVDALGFIAMGRNRVPNLLAFAFPPALGVGEATTSFRNSQGKYVTARIATKNYSERKFDEEADFYSVALSHTETENKINHFNLSVKNSSGKDVLFLETSDFEFFEEGAIQEPHGISFELGGVQTGQNVILLLDHSGSMSGMMDKLKLAAKAFVDLKSYNDNIIIAPFSNSIRSEPGSDDKLVLKSSIDNMPNGGGTNLYNAILTVYDIGEKLKGNTTIVVMTDGKASDRSQKREDMLRAKLNSKKLKIYAVALGKSSGVDEQFLQSLAHQGGGKYFRTEDPNELKSIYQTIGAELQSKYTGYYTNNAPPALLKITHPKDGALLTEATDFTIEVSNPKQSRLEKVEFFIDQEKIAESIQTADNLYTVKVNPERLSNGKHLLKVVTTADQGKNITDSIYIEKQIAVELDIIRPRMGDSVGLTVPIEVDLLIRANKRLKKVGFSVDGNLIAEVTSEPYKVSWDTVETKAGEHHIQVMAIFEDGTRVSDETTVRVEKEMSLSMASPRDGVEFSDEVKLTVNIENESTADPVVEVSYKLNDIEIGNSRSKPFSYKWDTLKLKPGKYIVRASAKTKSGKIVNASVSGTISQGMLMVNLKAEKPEKSEKEVSTSETNTEQAAKFFIPPENTEIILDASNSMWGQLKAGSKIEIAKQVLADIVSRIPEKTKVVLRVYGSQSSVKQGNCEDTVLLQPLAALNKAKMLKQIQGIQPRGKTPIAYSLIQAQSDLASSQGASVILLITDGLESCDGDPVEAARQLRNSGVDTKLHVIGYDVEEVIQQQTLEAIADAGGGKYFSASSSEELSEAIVEAATVEFRVINAKGDIVLQDAVGSVVHPLRGGKYTLKIDLTPPLSLDFNLNGEQTKELLVVQKGDEFILQQQN